MSTAPAPARRRHVLVVGIDGVRLDLLRTVPTPHLDTVAAAGFLGPIEIDDGTPTMSGPCWATIATGVGVAKHGVHGNHFAGHRLEVFPDFATRLARQDGRRTFVAGGWEPLLLARDGGPLFAAPGRLSYIAPGADTCEGWDACDEQVTAEAVHVLATDDPEVSFVYFGAVDETGHLRGCGADYLTAIERADARLGRLLAAVRARPDHAREAWTVIVVTDHGHRDGGGHGGRSAEERTAWVACRGPGVATRPPARRLRFEDVAAHVYAALDRPADPHWTLDGAPFTTPAAPEEAAAPAEAARPEDPLQAVLFDMDGTLVDTEPLWWHTVEAVARSLGYALTDADAAAVVGRSVADTAAHLHGATDGRSRVETIAGDLLAGFHDRVARGPRTMPGALELLDALGAAGIPLALVSASPRPVVDLVLSVLGPERFAVTVAEGETPRTKPYADPYLAAVRALGVEPRYCVAVEDSPSGLASAEAAGCRVLAVPSALPIAPADGRLLRGGLTGADAPLLRSLVTG
ncbi:HAD-IA family hydrolase [Streptomyces sp. NPDC091268]|uniref:HAD-IA family hydrolase n=1 Tax=Streptomyces sp. NPDC091268 TaxID=3365979 RepID=UPI0038142BFB